MAGCSRILYCLCLAALLVLNGAAAQDCSKMYKKGAKSLLFGGVGEAKRCVGKGCQSRTDFW